MTIRALITDTLEKKRETCSMATMFGYKLELPSTFVDRSTYTFRLQQPEGRADDGFRSNVVVVRDPKRDRSLDEFVKGIEDDLSEKMPNAAVVKDATGAVAGCDAQERFYRIDLEAPMPTILQRHVFLERDGWFYHMCCSSTQQRFQDDEAQFQSFIDAWS
jgi:hypothetical protein